MNNSSTTPPKAVRAYTSYNLFFQLEREYILQTLLGHRPTISKTDILFDPTDRTYYQGPPLPSRYQNLILPYDWHLPGKTQRRKRVHRKTHGKIGFHELNGRISSSWQVIDDEIRSFCTCLADIESIKYKKINKKTTTPKKSIVKKKTTNIKAKRRNSVVETMISEKDFFPNNEEDDHIIDDLIASLDWSMDFPPTQDVLISPTVSGEDFNQSMASIITGLADAGVITNERYRPGSPPYSTAIATQMKRLGYDTHLYYAGYGGWHRIEDFAIEQGFDHTHMGSSMDGGADTNEWGVTDKVLFSYIAEHFQTEKPTFNLILTSSNHPPYTVDLAKENCPVKEVPTKYQEGFDDGNASIEMLGHHWYSDHYLGKFVKQVASQEKGCLFAITGDHWGRIFPGPRPTFFEQAIVPLVLYGPDVLPKNIDPDKLSGSHYDLGATLIELSAEAGHQYHAMGNNILASSDKDIAISRLWYLGKDFILPASNDGSPQTLRGEKMNTPETFKAVRHHYNLMHGISWWRICEGNELPKE